MRIEGGDEAKRTNEIGMAIPLLEGCDIDGKIVTGDALLTQRALATYLVGRRAHYHFTVKGNHLHWNRISLCCSTGAGRPTSSISRLADHGRIETRRIWCSTALNDHLDFPHVGQMFLIERESIRKKTGEYSREIALGVTSRTPEEASVNGCRNPPKSGDGFFSGLKIAAMAFRKTAP